MAAGDRLISANAVVPAGLSRDEILKILEERARSAQHELARTQDAGADVLDYLAAHGAVATRQAVAANPAAPAIANRRLADDADGDVRAELARKIARLMPDLPREEQDHLRALTIETLERLARDQETRVRAVLAEGIKTLDCVPRDVVQLLARDVEEIVAGPILEYSPLLSDIDLIEILASAKAEEALQAVARRSPLSAVLSDAIVGSLDIPAVAALLANPKAEIREQTLERIIAQAEGVTAWHTPLTLRTDLSPRAIRRIATFVGAALIETLAAHRGLDEETQAALRRELRSRLARETESAPDTVAAALRAGSLDDGFLEAAAEAGQRDVVCRALAALAQVPVETVKRILAAGSAKPVTALVWHARLSMRVSFKIQSFIMHLPAGELLPARGGTRFPLAEEEMRWHLSYFNVAA